MAPKIKTKNQTTKRFVISAKVSKLIWDTPELCGKIAAYKNSGFRSVERWLKDGSPQLTEAGVVQLISEYTGLTREQILTEA